ncbi:MAG: hypothetical protein ACREHD_14560, partial [Pirellulales bacterium]
MERGGAARLATSRLDAGGAVIDRQNAVRDAAPSVFLPRFALAMLAAATQRPTWRGKSGFLARP